MTLRGGGEEERVGMMPLACKGFPAHAREGKGISTSDAGRAAGGQLTHGDVPMSDADDTQRHALGKEEGPYIRRW